MPEEDEKEMSCPVVGETLLISTPVPNNERLISISGVIPTCISPAYGLFENFLWTLVGLDREKISPITLLINSCGGDVDSFSIFHDFITMLKSPIYTVAGKAESMAAMMFILGTRGHRYIFPNGHIILHNCHIFVDGKKEDEDRERQDKLVNLYNRRFADIIEKRTGGKILGLFPKDPAAAKDQTQTNSEKILSLLGDDIILDAREAVKYGVADHIITPEIFASLLQ